jgi:hypothetical protein
VPFLDVAVKAQDSEPRRISMCLQPRVKDIRSLSRAVVVGSSSSDVVNVEHVWVGYLAALADVPAISLKSRILIGLAAFVAGISSCFRTVVDMTGIELSFSVLGVCGVA